MQGKGGTATLFSLRQTEVDIASSSGSSNSSKDFDGRGTKRTVYDTCVRGVDVVNHILVVALTVFTLCYSLRSTSTLNLHTTLCTIGYVLLMSEAIVLLAGDSILTNYLTHRAKRHIHWILQILGVICTVSGVVLMYCAKKAHFRSTHAILGITSVAIMLCLTVFGYPVFVAAKLRTVIRPVVIKFGHNFLGLCCFAIGMAAQCYGYKKYRELSTLKDADLKLICIIVVAVIAVLSARRALPALCRQFVSLFR